MADFCRAIQLDRIRTERAVQLLVQALRSASQDEIKPLSFEFSADVTQYGLNFWDPLFVQLETQKVDQLQLSQEDHYVENGNVIPLFCDRIFQALQSNEHVQSLKIANFDFTNHSEGIISFLDAAPSLTSLLIFSCVDKSILPSRNIADAIQRNTKIQTLHLKSTPIGEDLA